MFEIEKDVPKPEFTRGRTRIYPFEEMEVGDSFLATGVKPPSVHRAAHGAAKMLSRKFSVRALPEGVRVWRVA